MQPPIPYGTKVLTPVGEGHFVGWHPDTEEYLILFIKKDFPLESWKYLSPGGGPCVYRMILHSDIQADSTRPMIYANKKSGRRYLLLESRDGQMHIRSLETGFTWWTTKRSLEIRFERVESQDETQF